MTERKAFGSVHRSSVRRVAVFEYDEDQLLQMQELFQRIGDSAYREYMEAAMWGGDIDD